jgi:hypothetical protein
MGFPDDDLSSLGNFQLDTLAESRAGIPFFHSPDYDRMAHQHEVGI